MSIPSPNHFAATATVTDNAAHDLVAAPGAKQYLAVMALVIKNAHPSVSTTVTLRSGGVTAKFAIVADAGGDGIALALGGEVLFYCAAGEKLDVICGTTGANVYVFVSGFKAPC